jgi:predicted MPP superfamily phosphohydrolase
MKILALSDLHIHFVFNPKAYNYYKSVIRQKFENLSEYIDAIVITGDIFESTAINKWGFNPYETLRNFFDFTDVPIVFCLGNHEFAYNRINDVLKFFEANYDSKYNVHCIDVLNKYQIDNYNFIGNVLFYDNTLKNNPFAIDDHIVSNWLDSKIIDFIPSKECEIRKKQIKDNIQENKINILLTHCVPHERLNWFSINQPNSVYNQYSGCRYFLEELNNIQWSFSGHTHKRMFCEINGINCVNVGNDYFDEFDEIKYYIAEV